MWKLHEFSITQILRQVNFEDFRSANLPFLTHLDVLNFDLILFESQWQKNPEISTLWTISYNCATIFLQLFSFSCNVVCCCSSKSTAITFHLCIQDTIKWHPFPLFRKKHPTSALKTIDYSLPITFNWPIIDTSFKAEGKVLFLLKLPIKYQFISFM